MKIAISGTPGSGKTTIAKELSKRLGYKYYSIGEIRRKIARLTGLTIEELNQRDKEGISHRIVDKFIERLSSRDEIIVDGRMAPVLLKKSIKIFLYADPEESKKRIAKMNRIGEKEIDVEERNKKDIEMLKNLYGDIFQNIRYDITINTTNMLTDECVEKVIQHLKKYGLKKNI